MRKLLAAVAGSLAALSAGAGIASADVSAGQLQDMLSNQMASQGGSPPDSVVCPSDLSADLGASVTCAVTKNGETRGVTVTVASLDNGQVGLSMALARQ